MARTPKAGRCGSTAFRSRSWCRGVSCRAVREVLKDAAMRPHRVRSPSRARRGRAAETTQEPDRVLLHMPVDVRSASLVVLAVLASVFALRWAAAVFIPLMVSLMLTYALAPLVDRLERWKISRWLGAAVILLGLGGAFGWTGYSLSGSASRTARFAARGGAEAAPGDAHQSAATPTRARSTPCRRPRRSSSRPPRRTRPRWRRARAWRGW